MNITLDIGNTFIKIGAWQAQHLVTYLTHLSNEQALDWLKSQKNIYHILFCSVRKDTDYWLQALSPFAKQVMVLTHKLKLPFANLYQTPHTLGMDRVAGIAGTQALKPEAACLVIDAGTCITYDFITAKSQYYGGSISLGLQMRLQALAHFTQKLPLAPTPTEPPSLIGKNTQEAIASGVWYGYLAEIEGIIQAYQKEYGFFYLFLCGGDAPLIYQYLRYEPIFLVQDLVIRGLGHILQHQLSNKTR